MEDDPPFAPSMYHDALPSMWTMAPPSLLAVLINILAAVCLLIIRLQGCFVLRHLRLDRDLALLFAGPLVSILSAIVLVSNGVSRNYSQGPEAWVMVDGMDHVTALSLFGFFSLVVGLIAILLPQKSAEHLPPTKTQPEGPL